MAKIQTKHGALPQTSTRAYQKICEEYTLANAILEIAQNAFEHGNASLCNVNYKPNVEGVPVISFFNNGHPMTERLFKKFISEYHCHDISNSTPSKSKTFMSMKGYGLKDSVVYCSSDTGISKAIFRNYHTNGVITEWKWEICKSDGDKGSYKDDIEIYPYNIATHASGFEIVIENAKQFTRTELVSAQMKVAKSLNKEFISDGRTVQIVWGDEKPTNIRFYDPMHLDEIPIPSKQNIYNCKPGEYFTDDIIWFVKEGKFRGQKEPNGPYNDVTVRVVSAYFNYDTYVKKHKGQNHPDQVSQRNAGIYPLLGRCYLETGDNLRTHFGTADNGGGASRYRICPIITMENSFLWGIKSIKNNGVTPFSSNPLLCENYHLVDNDNQIIEGEKGSLYSYLKESLNDMVKFHDNFIKWHKGDQDSYYFKQHGFTDKKKVIQTLENFKSGKTQKSKNKPNETTTQNLIPETVHDQEYLLNKKDQIVHKHWNDNGVSYSLNKTAITESYNLSTKEDILFSVFELLEDYLPATQYNKFATELTNKIHPHYKT